MARLLIIVATIIMSFNVLMLDVASAKDGQLDQSLRKGETRQTMAPHLFSHPKIQKAYQVAKEIPWVLDSIYCYCFCHESPAFRHISLLSCYVDTHAAQ